MVWLLVIALWTAMLVAPLVLMYLFLPAGRECPRCGEGTARIRSRVPGLGGRLMGKRWCLGCGWEGLARPEIVISPLPTLEVVPEARPADTEAEADGPAPFRPPESQ
jgi:hypothetical protein